MTMRVAFVGLGRMGHGMAGRYLGAGFEVAIWNRSRAKADDLVARGAVWCESPAAAAQGAGAIVTMVADDEASHEVWLGVEGVATTAQPGAFAIECSTVSHDHALHLAAALQERGLIYIDCPVTGLPEAAASGKLTLLVGANADDLSRAQPYLAPLATTIRHFGPVGSGTIFKLINNLMGAIQIAGVAEGIAIAEQAGLDMATVRDAIAGGVTASPGVLRHAPRMIARDFAGATFTASLRFKDVRYALALAETLLPDVAVSRATRDVYAVAAAAAPDDDEARLIETVSRARS